MIQKVIKINPSDDLIVALIDLNKGEEIMFDNKRITLQSDIKAKHKFAERAIAKDEPVKMYGIVVGKGTQPIQSGELVSMANLKHDTQGYQVRPSHYVWEKPSIEKWKRATFKGYIRSDGQVGTRNYWLVIPLVFCENRNLDFIKNAFVKKLGYSQPDKYESLVDDLVKKYINKQNVSFSVGNSEKIFPKIFENIDGIKFLKHEGGCGGTREDADNLGKLLAGYINNPNVAGATILSLGCQHLQASMLEQSLAAINEDNDKLLLFFERQKFISEEIMLRQAITETFAGMAIANQTERQSAPIHQLCIGLKCGGSDGFSGITANPAMGYVSDLLAALGGKTILAEFPELCGVEQELIDRCTHESLGKKFAKLMSEYNQRAEAIGSGFSMNPSPGNIKDGLITDAMKSAGAAKKGGTSPVTGVLAYGEYIKSPGLNLLCTPGNDVEATTGMAGSGANLIIFSTGLGTPTGNPIAPVIKTATNSALVQRMHDIIDFDHGNIITKGQTIEQSGEELLSFILRVASGSTQTKAELLQQDDFIPWKQGVSL